MFFFYLRSFHYLFNIWLKKIPDDQLPFQNHVDGVVVLDEVILLLDEEVVDARDVDVHLAKSFVLLEKGIEDAIEVAHEVAELVQGEDRL